MKQIEKISQGDWDTLIILDACRFDYFADEYPRFLEGELSKVISPASCTIDWLKKTWSDRYDLTYLSANPIVNSMGVPRLGYRAAEHFEKIVDVWDTGWDEKLGTVPPWSMYTAAINGAKGERRIVHFMQPHQPYIGETKITFEMPKPTPTPSGGGFNRTSKELAKRMKRGTINLMSLKRGYEDNLRLVLRWVSRLAPALKGKTVITSDHGEFLTHAGPQHPCEDSHPDLTQVPWFEVSR